jgi:hypothetical protein
LIDYLAKAVQAVGYTPGEQPYNAIAQNFQAALAAMQNQSPEQAAAIFGELVGKFDPPPSASPSTV